MLQHRLAPLSLLSASSSLALGAATWRRGALACAAMLLLAAGCAEKQKVTRPVANVRGIGLSISEPTVRLASGTSCADDAQTGVEDRFRAAARSALSQAGFAVTDDPAAAMAAALEIEIDYCSAAGIVSGTTALELRRVAPPAAGAAPDAPRVTSTVWRGQTKGDQAKGETASSTLLELVEVMLYDPGVIAATETARR
jgi:hypothetical protein